MNCEVLGEVTGDMRFVVHDANDGSTPVNIDLTEPSRGIFPRKPLLIADIRSSSQSLQLPEELTVERRLTMCFAWFPSVQNDF